MADCEPHNYSPDIADLHSTKVLNARTKEIRVLNNSPTPLIPEAEIIRRAQQGDAEAFGILFRKHKTRVYALCLRMTRNAAEAEDLMQDAFLHVFRKLSAFRADSALSTWLYRVTVNTVLMHFRKKTLCTVSADKPSTNDQNSNPTPREFPTTDFRLAGSVDRLALNRALEELPVGYRRIFLLHEIAGYEHREIATFLGCSVGNSKSQLHKARQRIREVLLRTVPQGPKSRYERSKLTLKRGAQRWADSQTPGLPGTLGAAAAAHRWAAGNA
jgi:RNA polymerase sigma-70 factor (ECF subfamily)